MTYNLHIFTPNHKYMKTIKFHIMLFLKPIHLVVLGMAISGSLNLSELKQIQLPDLLYITSYLFYHDTCSLKE